MKKYKIVGSTKHEFMNIEMNIVFDDISIGKVCEVFGQKFTITQTGKCIILSSKKWVLSLLEIPNPDDKKQWGHIIVDPNELRINHEVDVFLNKKLIRVTTTNRLQEAGVSFECLFKFLRKEWVHIEDLSMVSFPFEYDDEYKLFTMKHSWDFERGTDRIVFDGSYSRYNSEGRCI